MHITTQFKKPEDGCWPLSLMIKYLDEVEQALFSRTPEKDNDIMSDMYF